MWSPGVVARCIEALEFENHYCIVQELYEDTLYSLIRAPVAEKRPVETFFDTAPLEDLLPRPM